MCHNSRFMPTRVGAKADSPERWSSVDDVTAHLGVVRDTIYRWIESKHMPAHRIGRLWKFKLSEVDDWVRSGGPNETRTGTRSRQKGRA